MIAPDYEAGSGELLVFTNSSNTTFHLFSEVLDRLAENYRVVGHNYRSLRVPDCGPFSVGDLVDDVFELVDGLGVNEWTMVGSSMGGFVALEAALSRPAQVKGLVLIGTTATRTDEQTALVNEAIAALRGHERVPEDWARWALAICFSQAYATDHPDVVEDWVRRLTEMPADGVAEEFLCSSRRRDLLLDLDQIECPVMVIHGSEDRPFPLEEAESWASRLPRCEFVAVEGVGHFASIEAADTVAELIERFCRETD